MATHALWTGLDGNGAWWSLRSDKTVWSLGVNGSWTQTTTQAQIDAALWIAAGANGVPASTFGFAVATCEGGPPPPPPPPQVT